jgi:hypothetical protein
MNVYGVAGQACFRVVGGLMRFSLYLAMGARQNTGERNPRDVTAPGGVGTR